VLEFGTVPGGYGWLFPSFTWLHTHAADGIIHTESPVNRTDTLGEFFDSWGHPSTANGPVSRTGLSRRSSTDGSSRQPTPASLLAHAEIRFGVGRPLLAPEQITFPQGL
jgi:hypothetical protein